MVYSSLELSAFLGQRMDQVLLVGVVGLLEVYRTLTSCKILPPS